MLVDRSQFEHRAVVVARNADELEAGLGERKPGSPRVFTARVRASNKSAWVFSGQGAQRIGMGKELAQTFPSFAAHLREICARFDRDLPEPLIDVMFAEAGTSKAQQLHQTAFTQPALFAFEVALARTLQEFGLQPDVVVGHSIGELAAAHVAGILSLDDAVRLVAARGRLMQSLPAGGAMIAVQATEDEIRELIARYPGFDIAGVNGPRATVVSGDEIAVERVAEHLRGLGRKTKRLEVSHAFHSHHLDAILDEFRAVAATVEHRAATLPFISNVTGTRLDLDGVVPTDYWVSHARGTVRFMQGVRTLEREQVNLYLEIGPQPALAPMVGASLTESEANAEILTAWRADLAEDDALTIFLARLHGLGVKVDWDAYFGSDAPRHVDLPTYRFQRQSFWLDAPRPQLELGGPASQWSYVETWARLDMPSSGGGRSSSHLLVVADDRDPAELVDDQTVLLRIPLDASVELMIAKLEEAFAAHGVESLVSALALREIDDARPLTAWLGSTLTLRLCQAVASLCRSVPLWILTRSAVAVGSEALHHPEQGLILGLARSFSLEHPSDWGGLLDLPSHEISMPISRVIETAGEDQLALRTSGLFARRLTRVRPTGDFEIPDETILITGGTGALGSHAARWLARRGAKHLVLSSRAGGQARGAIELRAELERINPSTRVDFETCDVGKRDDVRALLARLESAGEAPRLVIHAAGVAGTLTPLLASSPGELAEVADGKVEGARHLDEALRDADCKLVFFGSIAGTWGAGQHAAYAAANAYLDALARHRTAARRPTTCIAWGAWAGDGMASGGSGDQLERSGIRLMPPELAIAAVAGALGSSSATVVIADVDWQQFAPLYSSQRARPLFSDIPEATAALVAQSVDVHALRAAFSKVSIDELKRAGLLGGLMKLLGDRSTHTANTLGESGDPANVRATILAAVAEILQLEAVDPTKPISALGLDSLMAVELRARLMAMGINIPVAELLQGRSVDQLVQRLGSAGPSDSTRRASEWISIDSPRPDCEVRLICFPYAAGGPAVYAKWGELLGDSIEVAVAHLPGRGSRLGEKLLVSVTDSVSPLVEAILPLADKPLAFFGHCMGAIVMTEVLERLEHDHGVIAKIVFASGATPPSHYQSPLMHLLSEAELLTALSMIGFTNSKVLVESAETRELLMPMLRGDFQAVAEYSRDLQALRPLSASILALVGLRDVFVAPRFIPQWRAFTTADLELRLLDENHYFVESQRDAVVDIVREKLVGTARTIVPEVTVALERWESAIRADADPRQQAPKITLEVRRPALDQKPLGRLILLPDVLAAPFPLASVESFDPRWEVMVGSYESQGSVSAEALAEAFSRAAPQCGTQPVIFAGHGFGAMAAVELAARVAGPVLHLIAINAIPPHHYGLPFLDLLSDAEIERFFQLVHHPNPNVSLEHFRRQLELGSSYRAQSPKPLDYPITVHRAARSMWFSFHTSAHWADLNADVQFVDNQGEHFNLLDTVLVSQINGIIDRH